MIVLASENSSSPSPLPNPESDFQMVRVRLFLDCEDRTNSGALCNKSGRTSSSPMPLFDKIITFHLIMTKCSIHKLGYANL